MEISEIELGLLNKAKTDIQNSIMPLLQQVNQQIPEFVNKNVYVQQFQKILDNMFNDSEFNRAVLDQQKLALFEAICQLPQQDLINLGLEHLCMEPA